MLDRKRRNKEFQFYSGNFKRLKLLDFFNPKSAIRNPKSCLNGLFVQALCSCHTNSRQYHLLDLSTFIKSEGKWLTARELAAICR